MHNSSNCIIISPVYRSNNLNNIEKNNHHDSFTADHRPIPARITQRNTSNITDKNNQKPALRLIKPTNATRRITKTQILSFFFLKANVRSLLPIIDELALLLIHDRILIAELRY